MMPKRKSEQVFITEPDGANTVQIHVTGGLMPNAVFLQIIEHMKAHKDSKTIVFVVYDVKMMLLIRQAIPSEYYERIELYSRDDPETVKRREAMFLNMAGNAYGIYLFGQRPGDFRIIKENYRLAQFGKLGDSDTLDTIRAKFAVIPGNIIAIKEDGALTAWYVDVLAFSKLPSFFDNANGKDGLQDAG